MGGQGPIRRPAFPQKPDAGSGASQVALPCSGDHQAARPGPDHRPEPRRVPPPRPPPLRPPPAAAPAQGPRAPRPPAVRPACSPVTSKDRRATNTAMVPEVGYTERDAGTRGRAAARQGDALPKVPIPRPLPFRRARTRSRPIVNYAAIRERRSRGNVRDRGRA